MKISAKIRFFIILLFMLTVSACATVEPPYRGKLSDAMEVAADDFNGDRRLPVPESRSSVESETDAAANLELMGSASPAVAETSQSDPEVWYRNIMISRGLGRAFGGDYQDHSSVQLSAAGENQQSMQYEVYVGYEEVSLRTNSSLYPSIKGNLDILTAGMKLKHYYKPHSERVRPYLSGGAGGAYMIWSYRNPFTTTNGDIINSDNLSGFTLRVAAGIEYKPVKFMSLFAEASPKIHLWNERTGKGYDNDEFNTMFLAAFSLGLSIAY